MPSEITLKYLHPSIKTYITTDNYKYDTSVNREVLFVADVFDHGKDNVLQEVTTLDEFLFKYGSPNIKKFGQAGYNIEKWLTNGGSAVIMRLLPEDARYAHAVFNIQYKSSTNGKTVIDSNGNETKINDVYLRPVVAYIGVNNTSEKLLESELAEDRTSYPTTDGYFDNFIFAVYPEGRGEYYNDLGFRIRLNSSYDGMITSRVYTFEVIKYTSASTFDIIDGPYFVSFDPDAIDPNSQKSMFIETVVNSYSEYVKVKFNTENYIKLASIINNEVDPYIVDVISGKSRVMPDGSYETYFSSSTGKEEDVHIALMKYSSNGVALTDNGEYVLNISNNDETTADIVDIADNSRKIIYNNQKYITDYMRGFYNWLIQDRISQNLNKIISGNIESGFSNVKGLLLDKVDNLIYSNKRNCDQYSYSFDKNEFLADQVGSSVNKPSSWYLRTQEIINPGLKDNNGVYVGTATKTGYEDTDSVYISSTEMASTITPDGFIEKTGEHLISYYHNFMKYVQFVANYDIYNNTGFVISDPFVKADKYYTITSASAPINTIYSTNSSKTVYRRLGSYVSDAYTTLTNEGVTLGNKTIYDYVTSNIFADIAVQNDAPVQKYFPSDGTTTFSYYDYNDGAETFELYPMYVDDTYEDDIYIPIVDTKLFDPNTKLANPYANTLKVYDVLGNKHYQPINGTTVMVGERYDDCYLNSLVNKYLYPAVDGKYEQITGGRNYKIYNDTYLVLNKNIEDNLSLEIQTKIRTDEADKYNFYTVKGYYEFIKAIYDKFGDTNYDNYLILVKNVDHSSDQILDVRGYNDYQNRKSYLPYLEVALTDVIRFANAINDKTIVNQKSENGKIIYPNTTAKYEILNIAITAFNLKVDTRDNYSTGSPVWESTSVNNVITNFYFSKDDVNDVVFDEVFSERLRNGKLTNSFNKVASYSSLISKELDGKGKDTIINDITTKKFEDLNYADYSITTLLNVFVAGFESIINNMGSVTDYSNYSSLKYLIKTINNNLDLRSTYLTLLNVHRNNILDLSTKLAKANASIILGTESLENLYAAMDTIVSEANYLITNIINTVLNKTYTIYNLIHMDRVDNGKPYAYYFDSTESELKNQEVDPLGILNNIQLYGRDENDETTYKGMMPILEKILINITGENHYGEPRRTIYGGPSLISIYDDIKNGYVSGGLTQERYEVIYQILSESLSQLSDIHSIINVLINEKFISDIINTLIGTIDIRNTIVKYNGSSYSINEIWNYYNSDLNDGSLTQTDVTNLINEAIKVTFNNQKLPLDSTEAEADPVINYPYMCKVDIEDSVNLAKENKEIVKTNISKQDRVLASLNTLCYDNLVTDISAPISLLEGSDGSFTYDDSTSSALKKRTHLINDIRIKAYKGTWNPDVLNKDLFEFDHVLDANYEDPIKNAIVTLARDERQDFFYWADTKIQNTLQDALDWKSGFTNQTYFMSIIGQSQVWYDEYTSRNITLTSTYLIADMLNKHINSYGVQYPMAGSRRGVVGGFISNDWYPNEDQKEKLYKNNINYLEKDVTTIRIGSQNTNYPAGPLGQINNMLVLLRIKRTVEKIAKTYQFEHNTADTRSAMAAEINVYLGNWINNGACTYANATVYASDYDIIQRIVRVSLTLQFTGVIERIVINIDCPATI